MPCVLCWGKICVWGVRGPPFLLLAFSRFAGVLLDSGHEKAELNLHKEVIVPDTLVSLFDKYEVPADVDFVSIDTDSLDLWLFRALVASRKYRPRVICLEYNSNFALGDYRTFPNGVGTVRGDDLLMADLEHFPRASSFTREEGGGFPVDFVIVLFFFPFPHVDPTMKYGGDTIYGASLSALNLVAEEYGYQLVYVDRPLDSFFVRKDLLDPACPTPCLPNSG